MISDEMRIRVIRHRTVALRRRGDRMRTGGLGLGCGGLAVLLIAMSAVSVEAYVSLGLQPPAGAAVLSGAAGGNVLALMAAVIVTVLSIRWKQTNSRPVETDGGEIGIQGQ